MILILALLIAMPDVAAVKSEPDLDRRADLALQNADHDIDNARRHYESGDADKMQGALEDLRESVSLVSVSLAQTHHKPRSSKSYKNAELKTRALLRRLSTLVDEVAADDRKPVEDARQRVQEVHDQLLNAIMSKK